MTAYGTSLRCPGCGAFYANVSELAEAGGRVRSSGISLKADCGKCGRSWAINKNWRPNSGDKSKKGAGAGV